MRKMFWRYKGCVLAISTVSLGSNLENSCRANKTVPSNSIILGLCLGLTMAMFGLFLGYLCDYLFEVFLIFT